jgi:hypothetical protein
VKFDRDLIELAKLARKPYKQKKPKIVRQFPTWSPNVSTAEYIERFDNLNNLARVKYDNLNFGNTAQYDPTIPLCEVFTDE